MKKLFPLYLVIFFGFAGYSLMITLFTPMLLHHSGQFLPTSAPLATRTILLGVLLMLYPLGQFLGSPIIGAFSDHFGRRKILLLTLGLAVIFYALIAFSVAQCSLSLLMIFSFLLGLCEANIVVAQGAIADVATEANRNRFFGYIYLSASLAYVIGPLVGGKLADHSLVSWFNYALPFWLVCLLLLITLLWTARHFKETCRTLKHERIHWLSALTNLSQVVTNQRLRSFYFCNFLFYLAVFGFFRCYPMYLVNQFHMGVSAVSEFIAWVAVPIIITNIGLTSYLSKRVPIKTLTLLAAAGAGFFMIVIVLPHSAHWLWLTLFFTGLSVALVLPSCATLLSLKAKPDEQGRVMGNNQSLQVLAEALSGVIGGLIAAISISLPLIVLGLVALFASLLLLTWKIAT